MSSGNNHNGFQSDNSSNSSTTRGSTMEDCNLVGNDTGFDSRELRVYGRGEVSMAGFNKVLPEAYKDLEQEIQEMGHQFFGYFKGKDYNPAKRYLSDLISFGDERNLHKIMEKLRTYGRLRRKGMFGFVEEKERNHVHVIHDCAFSDGTCRCTWRTQIEPFGKIEPLRTFNKQIFKFTRTDWYDVFVYFFLRKRGDREIFIRGVSGKQPSIGKYISSPIYLTILILDLYLQISWYDGPKSITLGDRWYEAKIGSAVVSVSKKDKEIKELVEQLLCLVTMKFMAKNPQKCESGNTFARKRKRYY